MERPKLVAGDAWVFEGPFTKQRSTHTFVAEQGNLLLFTDGALSADRALFPGGVVGITIVGPITFPFEGAVAFPLSVGKKWRFSRVLPGRAETITTRADARVEAWERVRMADGTEGIGAFRIEIEETQAPPLRYAGVIYWTLWFAPETKCVVKWSVDSMPNFRTRGAELVEFHPAP